MTDIAATSGANKPVGFDADRYLDLLAHLDLPIERKRELIHTVGAIMRSFVDRAFGDDAAQLARKGEGAVAIEREAGPAPVLPSDNHNTQGDKALSRAFSKRAGRGNRKEKR
jgi:hypothetical protein